MKKFLALSLAIAAIGLSCKPRRSELSSVDDTVSCKAPQLMKLFLSNRTEELKGFRFPRGVNEQTGQILRLLRQQGMINPNQERNENWILSVRPTDARGVQHQAGFDFVSDGNALVIVRHDDASEVVRFDNIFVRAMFPSGDDNSVALLIGRNASDVLIIKTQALTGLNVARLREYAAKRNAAAANDNANGSLMEVPTPAFNYATVVEGVGLALNGQGFSAKDYANREENYTRMIHWRGGLFGGNASNTSGNPPALRSLLPSTHASSRFVDTLNYELAPNPDPAQANASINQAMGNFEVTALTTRLIQRTNQVLVYAGVTLGCTGQNFRGCKRSIYAFTGARQKPLTVFEENLSIEMAKYRPITAIDVDDSFPSKVVFADAYGGVKVLTSTQDNGRLNPYLVPHQILKSFSFASQVTSLRFFREEKLTQPKAGSNPLGTQKLDIGFIKFDNTHHVVSIDWNLVEGGFYLGNNVQDRLAMERKNFETPVVATPNQATAEGNQPVQVERQAFARDGDLGLSEQEKLSVIHAIAFTKNCRSIITGGPTGVLTLYNLDDVSENRAYPLERIPAMDQNPHRGKITSISMSADRSQMITTSMDGLVKLWDINPDGSEASVVRWKNTESKKPVIASAFVNDYPLAISQPNPLPELLFLADSGTPWVGFSNSNNEKDIKNIGGGSFQSLAPFPSSKVIASLGLFPRVASADTDEAGYIPNSVLVGDKTGRITLFSLRTPRGFIEMINVDGKPVVQSPVTALKVTDLGVWTLVGYSNGKVIRLFNEAIVNDKYGSAVCEVEVFNSQMKQMEAHIKLRTDIQTTLAAGFVGHAPGASISGIDKFVFPRHVQVYVDGSNARNRGSEANFQDGIVTSSTDGTVRLWNFRERCADELPDPNAEVSAGYDPKLRATFGTPSSSPKYKLTSLAVSDNGELAATGTADGSVIIWWLGEDIAMDDFLP